MALRDKIRTSLEMSDDFPVQSAGGSGRVPPAPPAAPPAPQLPGPSGSGGGRDLVRMRERPAPSMDRVLRDMGPADEVRPSAQRKPSIPQMERGRVLEAEARNSRLAKSLTGTVGRTVGLGSALMDGKGAMDAAASGDTLGATDASLRAGAGVLSAVGGPVASALGGSYLLGSGVGSAVNKAFIEPNRDLSDAIGGTINQGVRSLGRVFGQDWGVDDTAYLQQRAAEDGAPRTLRQASTAAAPAAATTDTAPKAPYRRVDPGNGAAPLYTNQPADQDAAFARRGGGFVGTVPAMDMKAVNEGRAAERELHLMRMGLQDRGDADYYINGAGAAGSMANLQERMANASIGQLPGLRAEMRQRNQLERDAANNAVTLRGQDITAETAATRLAYDRSKDERDFRLRAGEARLKRDDSNLKIRQDAQKSIADDLGRRFVTDEGKPDTAKVAQYMDGIDNYVADLARQAREVVQRGGPNAEQAAETLKLLEERGIAALDREDLQGIITRLEVGQRTRDASGFAPWSGDYQHSNNPDDFAIVGRESSVFGDRYTLRNGSTVPVRAVNRERPGNLILPDFGNPRSTHLEAAKTSRLREDERKGNKE